MQDGEPQVYTALTTMHVGYSQRQWQRLQLLFLVNSVVIPVMYAGQVDEGARLIASVVVLLGNIGSIYAVDRTNDRLVHIEKKLAELETLDEEGSQKCRVTVFSEASSPLRRISAGFMAPFLTSLFGWLVFTVYLALAMLKLK